jgi:hypothetical protein
MKTIQVQIIKPGSRSKGVAPPSAPLDPSWRNRINEIITCNPADYYPIILAASAMITAMIVAPSIKNAMNSAVPRMSLAASG